jgi:hypothetical protein
MKKSILFLAACLMASPAFSISWFEPSGDYRACILNPALPCPQSNYAASDQEKALRQRAFSQMKVEQQDVRFSKDSTGSVSDGIGALGFRMMFGMTRGTTMGLDVHVPYPRRQYRSDKLDLATDQGAGGASLLLGSDLLALGSAEEKPKARLLFGAEIPIANQDGQWKLNLEWVLLSGFRLRGSIWTVNPFNDLITQDGEYLVSSLRFREQGAELLTALRPLRWLDLGFRAQIQNLDPRGVFDDLRASGRVGQAAMSWQVFGPHFRWSQNLEWQNENVDFSYQESEIPGNWSLHMKQSNDVWVYQSKLQGNYRMLRASLFGERRLRRGYPGDYTLGMGSDSSASWMNFIPMQTPGPDRLQWNIVGADFRYMGDGLFMEPGVAWASSDVSGGSDPWLNWGRHSMVPEASAAWITSFSIGLQSDNNKLQYTWRQALPLNKSGAMHRFVLEGGF